MTHSVGGIGPAGVDLVELRRWSFAPEPRARFEAWTKGSVHRDFVDVRNSEIHFTPLARPLTQSRVAWSGRSAGAGRP